jgi:hypothetical protein
VKLHLASHFDYIKIITLEKSVERANLFSLCEKMYKGYVYRSKIEAMQQWMPPYILLCSWLGIFLDRYLNWRHSHVNEHLVYTENKSFE